MKKRKKKREYYFHGHTGFRSSLLACTLGGRLQRDNGCHAARSAEGTQTRPYADTSEGRGGETRHSGASTSRSCVKQIRSSRFASLTPDLIVTAAYGQILPKSVLDLPKYGCINIHASLLPKYRGGAPIHHAVMRGEAVTGVTIMYMAVGLGYGRHDLQCGAAD